MNSRLKKDLSNRLDKIISLAKRRGFVFPSSEIYGGFSAVYDYGPYGVELKNNIKQEWWKRFVHHRDNIVGVDAALIMNPKVWEASGHLKNFSDSLVEDKSTNIRYREDYLNELTPENDEKFEKHYKQALEFMKKYMYGDYDDQIEWTVGKKSEEAWKRLQNKGIKIFQNPDNNEIFVSEKAKSFNLMFKTFVGSTEETTNVAYFRPETAQGIFVNFKNILDSTRMKIPFGIAQIGKAFRNEITARQFIFRTREFEQMEIEYFIPEPKDNNDEEWKKYFEEWRVAMVAWMSDLGINVKEEIYELDVPENERAHYSKKTIDFEYKFPFGQREIYGLAYRTNYDLTQHSKLSGEDLRYTDNDGNKFIPHVIEPSLGVDRTLLAVLCSAYNEEKLTSKNGKEEMRIVMKFPKWLAPIKIAVFPLLKNKPELVKKAKEIFDDLKIKHMCEFDDNGNVGKRYRRQDEIGTPYCITVDFEGLDDNTVTVRDRDTMKQERIKIEELESYFQDKLN